MCEGYTDVIGFFQAGVPRAVATCGTALAEEHFTLLRNFARRIVLAYDADGAGQAAAGRFYEWERKHRGRRGGGRPARRDATPASWPAPIPTALRARRRRRPSPFLQFRVDRILDAGRPGARPRAGPGPPRRPWRRWPSTPTTWSATSTSCRSPIGAGSSRRRCATGSSSSAGRAPDRSEPGPRSVGARGRGRTVGAAATGPRARVREPDGDADGTPTGSTAGEAGRRRTPDGAAGSGPTARGAGPAAREFRPGLEALRLAVHRPEDVADRLEAVLFRDDLQRAALRGAGRRRRPPRGHRRRHRPQVRALLVRLTVEEPMGEPDDVVVQLVRDAAPAGARP